MNDKLNLKQNVHLKREASLYIKYIMTYKNL